MAIDVALEQVLGVENGTEGIRFDGRTDRGIFREALLAHGADAERLIDETMEAYLAALPGALASRDGRVLPGVWDLLNTLEGKAAMGLATGNMERGAKAKLSHYQLWDRFRGGGFGDVTVVRREVIEQAIGSIAAAHGIDPEPERAVVIGDTPLDVEAGQQAGARVLGVGTGRFTPRELLDSGADYAVEDLSDTAGVVQVLLD